MVPSSNCKEILQNCKVKIYFIVLKLILASVPEVKKYYEDKKQKYFPDFAT